MFCGCKDTEISPFYRIQLLIKFKDWRFISIITSAMVADETFITTFAKVTNETN